MFTGNVYYVYYCSVELGKLNNNNNNNNDEFISAYPFYTKFALRLKMIYKKEIVYYKKL